MRRAIGREKERRERIYVEAAICMRDEIRREREPERESYRFNVGLVMFLYLFFYFSHFAIDDACGIYVTCRSVHCNL